MVDEQKPSQPIERPKKKGWGINTWLGLLAIIAIGFCFLMAFTNAPMLLPNMTQAQLPNFQENMRNVGLILSFIFITALIFVFYYKDKLMDVSKETGPAVILYEPHTVIPKIREYARFHYGMNQVGNCVYISPLLPFKEASSVPPSRFFIFEKKQYGDTFGYTQWRVDSVRKIIISLHRSWLVGRDSPMKYWHGESKVESFRGIDDSVAGKRVKDLRFVKDEESRPEGSITEGE